MGNEENDKPKNTRELRPTRYLVPSFDESDERIVRLNIYTEEEFEKLKQQESERKNKKMRNEVVKMIKIEHISIGKVKLSIDDNEFQLNKQELRYLLMEAENALDMLGFLEVKHWQNIIKA